MFIEEIVNLCDIDIEIDGNMEDCSFDHEFGTEECWDFRYEGMTITRKIGDKWVDISKWTIEDLIDRCVEAEDDNGIFKAWEQQ